MRHLFSCSLRLLGPPTILILTWASAWPQTLIENVTSSAGGGSATTGDTTLLAVIGQPTPVGIASSGQMQLLSGFFHPINIDIQAPSTSPQPAIADQSLSILVTVLGDRQFLQEVALGFRMGGVAQFDTVAMTESDSLFRATIPNSKVTSRGVEYFVLASDLEGNIGRLPPSGIYSARVRVSNIAKESAQPGGNEENAYRMISIPLDLDDKSPAAVLVDDLGAYDKTKWRLVERLSDGTLRDFPQIPAMPPGKAFWLIVKESGRKINAGPGLSVDTARPFKIVLTPGWNAIGNPFHFTIPASNLALYSSDTLDSDTLDIVHFVGEWNDQSNAPVSELVPFEGYAVHNSRNSTDTLIIDPDLSTGRAPVEKAKPLWAIRISAKSQQAQDAHNFAGVAHEASEGWDAMDFPEPPIIGEFVTLHFPHAEWRRVAKEYAADIRPTTGTNHVWKLAVKSAMRDRIELSFNDLDQIPAELEIWLWDEKLDVTQNLRLNNHIAFASAGLESSKEFKLLVGKSAFVNAQLGEHKLVPSTFELSQNFPNPFNPVTTIRFGLPLAGKVTLRIYNLLGEEVVTLIGEEHKEAGYHLALWDARDASGRPVGSGIYFCRIHVGDHSMTRKMVFTK